MEGSVAKGVRRLYSGFVPESYDLTLALDDQAMIFDGHVVIKGRKTGRPSERLTFHQKGLDVRSAKVVKHDRKGDEIVEIVRINEQASYDELRLHAGKLLYPGDYTITLEFSGNITRPMNGIYPCFFKHDGQDKQLIATQFESHHAREAFPCIDEPEAKAIFNLSLLTRPVKAVLGNTPIKEQRKLTAKDQSQLVVTPPTNPEERLLTVFEPSPLMSTYLLAFAYGDMDHLEAKTKDGVTVRTYATPDNVKHTDFALDVAVKCLEFYNDYFDIPYPLTKCDFVALPDFASGAMENWGLITFREQALLVDPANTSLPLKQYVANVVAHELTHQWFGNLVTMRWWNDLWLNESFASWMSYLAVDALFPQWEIWTQFIVDEQYQALRLDALANTHPINVTINHPDEIRTIFDAISYEKGASVLHMLHEYIGPEFFRDGLRQYLKKHAYSNTVSDDLWAAWEDVSLMPVGNFMRTWTHQPGFPLLQADLQQDNPKLSQQRFYLNPKAKTESFTWPLPLLSSEPLGVELMDRPVVKLHTTEVSGRLVLNHHRAAFARVIYDGAHLESLTQAVRDGQLSELDRLGLLSDSFEAAQAGYSSSVEALKLLDAYKSEDSSVVWDIMAGGLSNLRGAMNDEPLREAMKPYINQLTAKELERLGWEEKPTDSHFDKLLRPVILSLAASADNPAVVKEALKRFKDMEQPEDVVPDIRGVVYGTAARLGGQAEFDKLWQMHNSTASSEERVTLSGALTAFEKPDLIDQALAKITTSDVRLQDAIYWLAYSFSNRFARAKAWQWMKANWQWLEDNLGNDLAFYRLPIYAARHQSQPAFVAEFESFFAKHMSPAFERNIRQGIETIEWQSAWRQRDLKPVKQYFDNYNQLNNQK